MIRVAVDAQIADVSRAGIGQVTAALLKWLPRVDSDATYIPLRPRPVHDFSMPRRWWWDQVTVPRLTHEHGARVLLKPGFSVPVRSSVPSVVLLHDLAARLLPHQLHRPSAWFYGRWMPWTLRFASYIVAVSQFTADEAICKLKISPHRIRVVHAGGDPDASPIPQESDNEVAKKFHLPTRFILHVGTIEPRKNLAFLVRAFKRFYGRFHEYELVLVGREGWRSADVRAAVRTLNLERSVRFLGSVTDDERRALYRRSRALAFPSLYEGFGLPPLEAMASGTPVVASASSSIPEVVGDAGLLILGYDEEAWAEALAIAAEDEARRRIMREAGLAQSRQFSWERAAKEIAAVLHEVAKRE